jgi:hypothetical protein
MRKLGKRPLAIEALEDRNLLNAGLIDQSFGIASGQGSTAQAHALVELGGNTSDALMAYVTALYRVVLHRTPDPIGLASWTHGLEAAITRQQVAAGFWESPEHRGLQVDGFYTSFLHRNADAAGRAGWLNDMVHGMDETRVAFLFLTSPEYQALHRKNTERMWIGSELVGPLYEDILGRPPDPSGRGWITLGQTGAGELEMTADILTSLEATKRVVDSYYADLLNRPPDPAGEGTWTAFLQAAPATRSFVAEAFLASEEFFSDVGSKP